MTNLDQVCKIHNLHQICGVSRFITVDTPDVNIMISIINHSQFRVDSHSSATSLTNCTRFHLIKERYYVSNLNNIALHMCPHCYALSPLHVTCTREIFDALPVVNEEKICELVDRYDRVIIDTWCKDTVIFVQYSCGYHWIY